MRIRTSLRVGPFVLESTPRKARPAPPVTRRRVFWTVWVPMAVLAVLALLGLLVLLLA